MGHFFRAFTSVYPFEGGYFGGWRPIQWNHVVVVGSKHLNRDSNTCWLHAFWKEWWQKALKKRPPTDIAQHGMSGVSCWALLMSPSLPGTIVRCFQCMTHRNFLYHSHIVLTGVGFIHMFFSKSWGRFLELDEYFVCRWVPPPSTTTPSEWAVDQNPGCLV